MTQFFAKEYEIFNYEIKHVIDGKKEGEASILELVKTVSKECIAILNKRNEDPNDENNRIHWIRLDHILDYLDLESIMGEEGFDFRMYYN